MSFSSISAVVISKNEERMIANCLDSLTWCDEVLVIDNGSEDSTLELAQRQGAQVEEMKKATFAELRNRGLEKASKEWILYVDADERVTPSLKSDIQKSIQSSTRAAFSIPRNNIHYGKWMQYGGWNKDNVVRLFRRKALNQWLGDVHEHAEFQGELGTLSESLVHLTHRNMLDGLQKTIDWTKIEAQLLFASNHPKITGLRLIKVSIYEFIRRLFLNKGWKDGVEGVIEAMVQAMNRFIVYEQLWEMQRKPPLDETYTKIEKEIHRLWELEEKK